MGLRARWPRNMEYPLSLPIDYIAVLLVLGLP
jgi:hypothetical protein